jgi:ABC-type branched-subunit amino acid transport system substrate-binding protein
MRGALNRWSTGVAAAAAAALALTACSSSASSDSGGSGKSSGSRGGGSSEGTLATAPGFDGKTFTVGQLTVTAGPLAAAFADSSAGVAAYVDEVNAKGGIDGKYPIKILTRDHGYDASKVVQAYQSTKGQVAAYAWLTGTPMVNATRQLLKKDNILAFIASGDGKFVYQPNLMSITIPAQTLALDGVEYMLKKNGKDQTFCALGTEGALADVAKQTLEYARANLGVKTGPAVAVPAQGDPTPQIQQLKSAGCQVVLLNALISPVASTALSTSAQLGFEPTWLGNASSWGPLLNSSPIYDYAVKHMLVVSDSAPWSDTGAAMKQLVASQQQYAPKANPGLQFVWGYNNTAPLVQVLTQAVHDGDVSRAGILKASQKLTEIDTPTQYKRAWGTPEQRKLPTQFCILVPDKTAPGGAVGQACPSDSSAAVQAYPYPKAS